MELFDTKEEKNHYDLEQLLKQVNGQRTIYAVNFNEDTNELTYRLVYSLNDIAEHKIKLTEKDMDNQLTLKLVETILLRFSLLKRKTRENINERLVNEYISSISKNRHQPDITEEIDKRVLLERLKERKNDIINYFDEEIATRVAITTMENIAVTSLVNLVDQSITKYLLAYTFVAPFIYSYVPYKIDTIRNKHKYNKLVDTLENEEYKPKPNLKMFCVVNKKVHELEAEDSKFFAPEIKELQDIMEMCYTNGRLDESTIDIEIVEQIEEVYNRINLKRFNRKTISFTEYLARKKEQEDQSTDGKVAKLR